MTQAEWISGVVLAALFIFVAAARKLAECAGAWPGVLDDSNEDTHKGTSATDRDEERARMANADGKAPEAKPPRLLPRAKTPEPAERV